MKIEISIDGDHGAYELREIAHEALLAVGEAIAKRRSAKTLTGPAYTEEGEPTGRWTVTYPAAVKA